MTDVKASIVITYYNEARFIDAAVRSALNQTFDAAYEVILVDDGSDVPVTEVLEANLLRNSILHVIRQENGGVGAARHAGIRRAAGRWITFLDADDRIAPNKLARHVAAAEALDSPMAVIFTGTEQRPEGNLKYCHLLGDCVEINDDILRGRMPSGASILMPRKLYFDCGGFDGTIRSECQFLLLARLIGAKAKFYVIPEPLYIQTIRPDSNRHIVRHRLDSIDRVLKTITDLFVRNEMKELLPHFCRRRLLAQIKVSMEDRKYVYSYRLARLFRRHRTISQGWLGLIFIYVAANAVTSSLVNTFLWNIVRRVRVWTQPRISTR